MNIKVVIENGFTIISLDGDLDASTAIQLDTAIKHELEQKATKIVIDCNKLNYVSSSGLGVFISYLSDFEKENIYFALLNVKEKILNTLNILGLTKLLNIIGSLPNV
jgi:anti-sigma B factor antagonist